MEVGEDNVSRARRYLAAIEAGSTGDSLARFFTADVVQEEFPNRLMPNGARRDLAGLLQGAEAGQRVLTAQRFDIQNIVANGDSVVLELLWIGTLAVPIGTIAAGGEMKAHFATILDYRDGLIAAQRNYDCFEPF